MSGEPKNNNKNKANKNNGVDDHDKDTVTSVEQPLATAFSFSKDEGTEVVNMPSKVVITDKAKISSSSRVRSLNLKLPDNFISCPSFMHVRQEDCLAAGEAVEGVQKPNTPGGLFVGDWSYAPYGCFLNKQFKYIQYNTNRYGKNDGRFEPVCKENQAVKYNDDTSCPPFMDVGVDDCAGAGFSLGATLNYPSPKLGRDDGLWVGSWNYIPKGCFMNTDANFVQFNTHDSGGLDDERFVSVCTISTVRRGSEWRANPANSPKTSPSFSEENGGKSAEGAIYGIKCSGNRCDNKRYGIFEFQKCDLFVYIFC